MKSINRIKYYNPNQENFEIFTLENFFASRPRKMLETDFRLNFWCILYILEGEGTHSIDFTEYSYTKGDLIVLEKNQIHSFRVNYNVKGYIININEPFFLDSGGTLDLNSLVFFQTPYKQPLLHLNISKEVTSRQLIDLLYREYPAAEYNSKNLIKALFNAFVNSIRKENQDNIKKIKINSYENYYKFRELVEKNFKTLKTVSDYEKIMGVTKKTINQSCRECADISAKTLIINRILLEAKRLLVQGKLRNYQIAEVLGFEEAANFSNFFKRYTNTSMTDFRHLYEVELQNSFL